MQDHQALDSIMGAAPVIPVVVIHDVGAGVNLARALVKGGLPAIEVTLRTPVALEALRAIADEVEGAIPGAGTVLNPKQYETVVEIGARFVVSPGWTKHLHDAAENSDVPLLPGASTPSEIMHLGDLGYQRLKFFPAEQSGGASYLKSISSPLPDFKFCPTGGISQANASNYLSLPNVICVGGSWVAPNSLVQEGKWDEITDLAKSASDLK